MKITIEAFFQGFGDEEEVSKKYITRSGGNFDEIPARPERFHHKVSSNTSQRPVSGLTAGTMPNNVYRARMLCTVSWCTHKHRHARYRSSQLRTSTYSDGDGTTTKIVVVETAEGLSYNRRWNHPEEDHDFQVRIPIQYTQYVT